MATRKWGTEKLVNTTAAGNQADPKVTVLPDGRIVIVWQDSSGAHAAVRGQIFDTTGNRIGGEIPIFVAAGNDEVSPSVSATGSGDFYVTWTQLVGSSNYILGSVYDPNGAFVRSQPADFDSSIVDHSDSAVAESGTATVWEKRDGISIGGGPGIDIGFTMIDNAGHESPVTWRTPRFRVIRGSPRSQASAVNSPSPGITTPPAFKRPRFITNRPGCLRRSSASTCLSPGKSCRAPVRGLAES